MQLSSDWYDDAARVHTQMVERDRSDAADAISQICSTFGARAASRAALIIKLLSMEICLGELSYSNKILCVFAPRLPRSGSLLEQAVADCLQAWDIDQLNVQLQVETRLYS